MIKIYTNVITRKHYDAKGDLFRDGLPNIFFNATDTVLWQLCSRTPDIVGAVGQTPETEWTKYTGYADYNAIGAFLTADDDYVKRMQGTLSANVSSGSVSTVSATISNAGLDTIPMEGSITLFDSNGDMEVIEYTEAAISGQSVTFTIAEGTTLEKSYSSGDPMDVVQACLMQATLDTTLSDVANGLFAFQITASSRKLHDRLAYANVRSLDVRGLELAIFNIDSENSTVVDLERYAVDTFSIRSGMADTSMDAQVTPQRENQAVTLLKTLLGAGVELQFSQDGVNDWHATQSTADDTLDKYYRFRLAGGGGAWSIAIRMIDGSAENARQYAADAARSANLVAEAMKHVTAPACTDMGIVLATQSVSITWGDPADLMLDGWMGAKVARTVAVMKIGSMPEDYTDGVIVAATSRSPETDTFTLPEGVTFQYLHHYRENVCSITVEDSDTVCIKLFTCTMDGIWNDLPTNEYPSYTSYSWGQLAEYAEAGTFLTHMPLGSALDMEHGDYAGHQWIVAGQDCFQPKNPATPHHIGLLSRYVLFTAPCDAPETQWALTEDTAAVSGITYGLNIAGSIVTLTAGTDYAVGDTSCTYNGVTYPISDWYEKNPDANYANGSNFTPQRNDVQWMKSEGKGGEWFVKQNLWDACNSTLAARNGFLRNLPAAFRNCIIECTRTAYVYTSFRTRGVGSSVQFDSKCFPLNLYEIFKTIQGGVTEGKKQLDWFEGGASNVAYLKDGTTASSWWSASAGTVYANLVYYVTAAGASTSGYAHNAVGFRPACAFGKKVSL